ncbi:MAG: hypothetical protein WC091_01395 [Sulfuricellaceae bacterium]
MKPRYLLLAGLIGAAISGCNLDHELLGGLTGADAGNPSRLAATSRPRTAASGSEQADASVDLRNRNLDNPLAYLTSQCFTKTVDTAGRAHNPCFSCHQPSREPNFIDDGDIQLGYDFPGLRGNELANPWLNLFKDRSAAVAAINDADILAYVRQDNYQGDDGQPQPARTLAASLPVGWDANGNGRWDGYLPDAAFNFDAAGFDHRADGGYTGWRAFAYAPFPGTFWPTNGSTDDVLIRLAPVFRQNWGTVRYYQGLRRDKSGILGDNWGYIGTQHEKLFYSLKLTK